MSYRLVEVEHLAEDHGALDAALAGALLQQVGLQLGQRPQLNAARTKGDSSLIEIIIF